MTYENYQQVLTYLYKSIYQYSAEIFTLDKSCFIIYVSQMSRVLISRRMFKVLMLLSEMTFVLLSQCPNGEKNSLH